MEGIARVNKNGIYLVINPAAGGGKGARVGEQITIALKERNIKYECVESNYAGDMQNIINNYCEKYGAEIERPLLLIIGGDGTLNEAIQSLGKRYSNIPLSYIAAGSGNDFARSVDLPKKPLQALAHILAVKQPKWIEVGHYKNQMGSEDSYFINNLGLGFDAMIVKLANESLAKKWLNKLGLGTLSYVFALLKSYFKQASYRITLSIDGQIKTFDTAFLVTITNHPYFGGGVAIAPSASNNDGLLDLVVVPKITLAKLVWLFIRMLSGGHHVLSKDYHHYQAESIKVTIEVPVEGQRDGETLGKKAYQISIKSEKRQMWL